MPEEFYRLIGQGADPIAWWQMCVRATIAFAWALILYRVVPRRAFGSTAAIDIVVVVVLGSMLSRAITGNAPLLPVFAATALLAVLYSGVSLLALRFRPVSRLVKGRSVRLIRDGKLDRAAMREAQLGDGDLRESLRQQGVQDIDEVAAAHLERNGDISVIRKG